MLDDLPVHGWSRAVLLVTCLLAGGARAEEPPAERGLRPGAVPILSYDPSEGVGYGANLKVTDFGDGESPFRFSIEFQAFAATNGVADHFVAFDVPGVTPWLRLLGKVEMKRSRFMPYYGVGNDSPYVADTDVSAYDRQIFPSLNVAGLIPLGGPLSAYASTRFLLAWVRSPGSSLLSDASQGLISGAADLRPGSTLLQRYSELGAGLRYDTRDNEFAPTTGSLHEVGLRVAHHLLGSDSDVIGATLNARLFLRPIPDQRRLVLALRLLADAASAGVPFFLLPETGGLTGPDGLGGAASLRGLPTDRYQGAVKILGNAELRWRFLTVDEFELGSVVALDAGRVWARLGQSDPGTIHAGGDLGLRVAWSQQFVVRVDFGIPLTEPEGGGLYLAFGEMF